jgi:hypothetical protein
MSPSRLVSYLQISRFNQLLGLSCTLPLRPFPPPPVPPPSPPVHTRHRTTKHYKAAQQPRKSSASPPSGSYQKKCHIYRSQRNLRNNPLSIPAAQVPLRQNRQKTYTTRIATAAPFCSADLGEVTRIPRQLLVAGTCAIGPSFLSSPQACRTKRTFCTQVSHALDTWVQAELMEMRAVHGICDGRMGCDESVELIGLTSGPYIFDRIERGARS